MVDHGGLTRVRYFGRQQLGDTLLYQSGDPVCAWTQLFRVCICIGGNLYYPEINQIRQYP